MNEEAGFSGKDWRWISLIIGTRDLWQLHPWVQGKLDKIAEGKFKFKVNHQEKYRLLKLFRDSTATGPKKKNSIKGNYNKAF